MKHILKRSETHTHTLKTAQIHIHKKTLTRPLPCKQGGHADSKGKGEWGKGKGERGIAGWLSGSSPDLSTKQYIYKDTRRL